MSRSCMLSVMVGCVMSALEGCVGPDTNATERELPTPRQFDPMVLVLNESTAAHADFMEECLAEQSSQPMDSIEVTAAFLGVDPLEVADVLCPRLLDAITLRRLSQEDFQAMQAGKVDPDLIQRLVPLLSSAGIAI